MSMGVGGPREMSRQAVSWKERTAAAHARADEWRRIRALVIRLGVAAADADDIAQEVAIGLYQTASILDRGELVQLAARSKASDYRRTRYQGRRAYADAAPQLRALTAQPNGEAEMIARAPLAILLRAVDALEASDPALHEVVRLHLDGCTLPEIAAVQGTPYGTAVSRTHRARSALRETLHRWTAEDEGRALRAALRGAEQWQ